MPEPSVSSLAIYQLRVVLRGVSPLVWRRLLVASEASLAELHTILQHAFGWGDDHLHRFLIHGTACGLPRLGGTSFRDDARRVPLSRFRLHRGERFRYEYWSFQNLSDVYFFTIMVMFHMSSHAPRWEDVARPCIREIALS
jgi:hypothetical protein